jgi:ADP-ribosyl-[dinitrogen reductase] hydrolase
MEDVTASVRAGEATQTFAQRLGGGGVSGYIYHTVPAVIHAWLSHPEDFPAAVKTVISCGGDSDTTGSILGGIVGARVGPNGIPDEWIDGLILWPRGIQQAETLAANVAALSTADLRVPAWKYLVRNAWFDTVVLLHGLRRLGPPY